MSPLREGLDKVELTTRVTFAVLALASGVYTYLGVRELLDGPPTIVFFAAIIYSAAVSVGIYAFWTVLMRFAPHVRTAASRAAIFGAMALGSVMIVAMSSWLNAAALAGSAALEKHLATALEGYVQDLGAAHQAAIAAQSLRPDIEIAAARFDSLAADERDRGALTGTNGSGTVVQLLTQMSAQMNRLAASIGGSVEQADALYARGSEHVARMRELVSASGPIGPRSDAFAAESLALAGVVTEMQQNSVAPAVRRAADDLSLGFIAPIADGFSVDLIARQTEVVGNVQEAVAAQSAALAAAADQLITGEPVVLERYEPLSAVQAVIVYARDFLPSWAGAISIDLMPAVIIIVLTVVYGIAYRNARDEPAARNMSAADLMTAMSLLREVEAIRGTRAPEPVVAAVEPASADADDETERLRPRQTEAEDSPAREPPAREAKIAEFHLGRRSDA